MHLYKTFVIIHHQHVQVYNIIGRPCSHHIYTSYEKHPFGNYKKKYQLDINH